jgi:hypothetical protein
VTRTKSPANVGAKSVQPEVRLRGKPCSLKRHFKGCLRQVIGYLDMLAAHDHERFAWCSVGNIQRHARKWKTGVTYSRWQIFFCLREAKELGVMTSAMRTRHGIPRKGFVVTSHDALMMIIPGVIPDKTTCVLEFKSHSVECQTTLENSQTTLENAQTTLPITLDSHSDHTGDHTSDHTKKSQQVEENETDSPDADAVLDETLDEVRRALALGTLSSQPCKKNPEKREPKKIENEIAEKSVTDKTLTPPRNSSSDDLTDQTQTRGQGKTIGNEISIEYAAGAEIIEAVSDSEFDTEALANYSSTDDLVESCITAHAEMSDQPFLGRRSYADVMGRAMKLLRVKYDANAPRGWLPVIKRLRASKANPETERAASGPQIDLSKVLIVPWSAIHAVSHEDADALESERQTNPVLSTVLIDAANRLGVPGSWVAGLEYADAVISELQRQNQPVPEPLASIQKKLQGRVSPVAVAEVQQ